MIKDQESLQRMSFLIQAARLYQSSFPEYSSHFLYDFIQLSEKKIIRIDKKLKKKINKKTFSFRKNFRYLSQFISKQQSKQQKSEMKEKKFADMQAEGQDHRKVQESNRQYKQSNEKQ